MSPCRCLQDAGWTQRVGDGTVLIAVRLRPMGYGRLHARCAQHPACPAARVRPDPEEGPDRPARRFPLRREAGARLVAVAIVSCGTGPAMAWPSLLASSFSRRAPGFHSSNFSPNWLRKSCGLAALGTNLTACVCCARSSELVREAGGQSCHCLRPPVCYTTLHCSLHRIQQLILSVSRIRAPAKTRVVLCIYSDTD